MILVEKQSSQSVQDIQNSITNLFSEQGFGVLAVHDIGNTLRSKGQEFIEQVLVYEICNPVFAAQVLKIDMQVNAALPCRFSVYTKEGKTFLSYMKPTQLLKLFADAPELVGIAKEIELRMQKVFDAIE